MSKTTLVARRGLAWLGIGLLVFLGLVGPRAVPYAQVALWYVVGGPPLDFDAPHNGQVVAHIVEDPTCGRHTIWLAQLR
jgi:hypothetical protein